MIKIINIQEYLNNYYKGSMDQRLDIMKYFIKDYNNFEDGMKFIHIAGTNGKGSCTEIMNNILINQGYKVGKFITPHLIKYNERISINNKEISDEEMSDIIEELEPKIQKYNKIGNAKVSAFELVTMIALLYFYRNNVDFAVLETGLGGIYDGTNVISKPLVSIITSIGYDHMHILGNTLPEIAYQKAGIIKQDSNTVFFAQDKDVNEVFAKVCEQKNNNLHLVSSNDIDKYKYDNQYQYFKYKDLDNIEINLKGKVQVRNASICIEAINILNRLGYFVSEDSIRQGLKTLTHNARMETLNEDPIIVFDGAHNEQAIINLQETINMYYKNYNRIYVIAILQTKDYKKILDNILKDENATFILTSGVESKRYVSSKKLYDYSYKIKKDNQVICEKTLKEAVKYCMQKDEHKASFIIGSLYTYSIVIEEINKLKK